MPFLLPIFDPATYGARGVISVMDIASRTRIRGVTRRWEVKRRMRRRCQITNNRYQTANVTAGLSRQRVTLTPLSRSSFYIDITIISCPAGQAWEGVA
ncbi:MAG: hypothetical protein IJQ81_03490 [Oscillibacter sp.]|nr:hypothetical protein [Oscillibacter sp.]